MGKVKKEGRLFYKKVTKSSDAAILPEAVSSFKFKPIENVPTIASSTETSTQPSKQSNPKKLTFQQRKENLINKISVKQPAIAKKRKQQKNKLKKQKQQVARVATLSNLSSLKNALPSLNDSLPSLNSLFMLKTCAELKTGVPKFDKKLVIADEGSQPKKLTKAMKTRHKKKVFMKRYDYLQKLMSDVEFKKNPRKVIAEHVRNRRVIEDKFENKKRKK